ncbi:MAG: DNA-3-methyladenine glycosylase [Bacteroidetes bacterium]|nr:MAG: DNA-3-methyladenine glycosylase [Bacteroidota bacterium]
MPSLKLTPSYYRSTQVVALARDLLGKYLYSNINNQLTGGIITETEAYAGVTDKASHAYNGRFTNRTKTMYQAGGISYVYFTYGMHHLFNVVTGPKEVPHAILIRGIYPLTGGKIMLARTGKKVVNYQVTNGPAKMTKAMGITKAHNGISLTGNTIWIEDKGVKVAMKDISTTPRIGIDYADEDALLPYRFVLDYRSYFNNTLNIK